uniref:Uncharacterized protein n=1 Tax=Podarcis muralis TaxID=64176 RepID=A0A670HLZ6_PODMU
MGLEGARAPSKNFLGGLSPPNNLGRRGRGLLLPGLQFISPSRSAADELGFCFMEAFLSSACPCFSPVLLSLRGYVGVKESERARLPRAAWERPLSPSFRLASSFRLSWEASGAVSPLGEGEAVGRRGVQRGLLGG